MGGPKPGASASRRSHFKSRKGCETCKRRHVRCDETFPQWRVPYLFPFSQRCTKYHVRCPYNDLSIAYGQEGSLQGPDLMWTPEIVASIEQWKQTGISPFPYLDTSSPFRAEERSPAELRLIHHMCSIFAGLEAIEANHFTLWTRYIPAIINIGCTHEFVLESLLAFSATHIAWLTGCPQVEGLAYEHRITSLQGLQEAINTFSRETSDAILAASIVLSWQATDWTSWNQLVHGTSTVARVMGQWMEESIFLDFFYNSDVYASVNASPSPSAAESQESADLSLATLDAALENLQKFLHEDSEDIKRISRLVNFLESSREIDRSLGVAQRFEFFRPLRDWLFYFPVASLQRSGATPSSLVVIAYYHTVATYMARLFPDVGAACFGSLSIRPIEEIVHCLQFQRSHQSPSIPGDHLSVLMSMMDVPIAAIDDFRRSRANPYLFNSPQPTLASGESPFGYYEAGPFVRPTVSSSPSVSRSPAFSYERDLPSDAGSSFYHSRAASPFVALSPGPELLRYLRLPSPANTNYAESVASFDGRDDVTEDAPNHPAIHVPDTKLPIRSAESRGGTNRET